jgi:hypothetical protein
VEHKVPCRHGYVAVDRLPAHFNPSTVQEPVRCYVFCYPFNGQAFRYIPPFGGQVSVRLKQVFRGRLWTYEVDAAHAVAMCHGVSNDTYDALSQALQPEVMRKSFADR